jgi:general stress protein 26
MDLGALVTYVQEQPDAVVSSLGPGGEPQSAYLDITATDRGELVFNAREASRKVRNIRRDPRVSVVVGGRDGTTLQVAGVADLPDGADLARCAAAYGRTFPQFAASAGEPDVVIVRVRPTWARFGDYRAKPPVLAHPDLGPAGG